MWRQNLRRRCIKSAPLSWEGRCRENKKQNMVGCINICYLAKDKKELFQTVKAGGGDFFFLLPLVFWYISTSHNYRSKLSPSGTNFIDLQADEIKQGATSRWSSEMQAGPGHAMRAGGELIFQDGSQALFLPPACRKTTNVPSSPSWGLIFPGLLRFRSGR